jgi:RNA polymerase sigma factor (TIGR02999 family)
MGDITELLGRARDGDRSSLDAVFARLYPELKRIAQGRLGAGDDTLSATALVNEAWLRLSASETLDLKDRRHFLACAARAMRRLLIDHVRAAQATKRGDGRPAADLDLGLVPDPSDREQLLAIDQALDALGEIDPAQRELVELHWFAGLDFVEIATVRGVNERTVRRGWQRARAFLQVQLSGSGPI